MSWTVECADATQWLNAQPADSADLIFGSPPYMDARTYGIDAARDCQAWVDWMLDVTAAAVRVSKGLVLWVVSGVQRDGNYWPGCEGLAWEWWKRGNHLWRPVVWWKVDENEGGCGIPGSGGKQWLRADWEYVLAFKKEGWLPWADPLVMGHEPIYASVGGQMSNRTVEGRRINAGVGERLTDGRLEGWNGATRRPNGKVRKDGATVRGKQCVNRRADGKRKRNKVMEIMDAPGGTNTDGTRKDNVGRPMPKVANPGNVLPIVVKARVGGGHIGSSLAHLSEAPFPEDLAEFFIRSFCPEGGLCIDPFSGSGTTGAVCRRWGRAFRGCDIRESQVLLSRRRIEEERTLFETMGT